MISVRHLLKTILFKLLGEERTRHLAKKVFALNLVQFGLTCFSLNRNNLPKRGPLTYDADGLATVHNCDFMSDPTFIAAYKDGINASHKLGDNLHFEWRAYVACWAAEHVRSLAGDYVECGCYTGILSRTIASYIDFKTMPHKRLFLFDTFEGIPLDQLTADENSKIQGYRSKNERLYCGNYYEIARKNFEKYNNVVLVEGCVPQSLSTVDIDKVCYLSIDMNIAYPEIEALKWFWEKLTPGAVAILDDYGFRGHEEQKNGIDDLGNALGFKVLSLPTGQGLIIKKME